MKKHPQRGFALILTLSLLSMLILVVFAISSVGKVDSEINSSAVYQTQARQNALLGLKIALGRLQESAGLDTRVTAQAGISPSTLESNIRWTGVWDATDTDALYWLVSGNADPSSYSPEITWLEPENSSSSWRLRTSLQDGVVLIGEESIRTGSGGSPSYTAGDGIIVPIERVSVASSKVTAGYAYWISDEGVKLSLAPRDIRDDDSIVFPYPKYSEFGSTFDVTTKDTSGIFFTRQLSNSPISVSTSTLKRRFHEVTLSALSVIAGTNSLDLKTNFSSWNAGVNPYLDSALSYDGTFFASAPNLTIPDELVTPRVVGSPGSDLPLFSASDFAKGYLLSGGFNLNSLSVDAWRAILEIARYKVIPGSGITPTLTGADMDRFALAYVQSLMSRGYPYRSIAELRDEEVLTEILENNNFVKSSAVTIPLPERYIQDDMLALLAPVLVARSDTFIIRAYGDAVNAADESLVESAAYCEAMVQRIPDLLDSTRPELGRRFVITYFRWLGTDDI